MSKPSLYEYLRKDLPDSPISDQLVNKLEEKYGTSPMPDANTLLTWLYESLYDQMGWRKRHIEEGENEKAVQEMASINITSKAISLLEPLAKTAIRPSKSRRLPSDLNLNT